MLDTLAATMVTAIAVAIVYTLLFPSGPALAMETIESKEIAKTIEVAAQTAREWHVRSRTASYFSAVTLPMLVHSVLQSGRGMRIRIQVLDPTNDALMAAYARFRSNNPGGSAEWTSQRVKNEIYGTLVQAALCNAEAPRLDISVGFSPAFWVLSLDMTDELSLVTDQNKGEPALLIRKTSSFFAAWCDDFEASFSECRHVQPTIDTLIRRDLERPDETVVSRLQAFFVSVGLPCPVVADVRSMVQLIGNTNHYA